MFHNSACYGFINILLSIWNEDNAECTSMGTVSQTRRDSQVLAEEYVPVSASYNNPSSSSLGLHNLLHWTLDHLAVASSSFLSLCKKKTITNIEYTKWSGSNCTVIPKHVLTFCIYYFLLLLYFSQNVQKLIVCIHFFICWKYISNQWYNTGFK